MTFRSLALSNVKGNLRAYSAFFLSSVFSVLIFYLYAAFIFHPDIERGNMIGAKTVQKLMTACEYLIIIFSFCFVLYSNSAFVKTRAKEFGLLSLFGTTRNQLRKMVLIESAAIAVLSIAVGLGVGVLLSKLFFMGLTLLLQSEAQIVFVVPVKAVIITTVGFFLLFMLISLITAVRVGRRQIVELLQEARKPRQLPASSPLLSILAALCLAAGYTLACMVDGTNLIAFVLPIVGLVTIGTYFMFTQLSIALTKMLERNKRVYYRRTNMLIISQMIFKLRDNARILFIVSIMSAVIVTAVGSVYAIQQLIRDNPSPYTLGFVEYGRDSHDVIDPNQLESILTEEGFKLDRRTRIVGLIASDIQNASKTVTDTSSLPGTAMVISEADYNKQAHWLHKKSVKLKNGQGTIVMPFSNYDKGSDYEAAAIQATVNGSKVSLQMKGYQYGAVLNLIKESFYLLVISDQQYEALMAQTPADKQLVSNGYKLHNWEKSLPAMERIEKLIPKQREAQAETDAVRIYVQRDQLFSLFLFIGMFVSLLFFIAAGSMIYFKLFTELQEDRAYFLALTRIGMTPGEVKRIVVAQVGIIFVVPCLVGIVHSIFAMYALGNALTVRTSVLGYSVIVMGIYIVMQFVYFLFSCSIYIRSIGHKAVG